MYLHYRTHLFLVTVGVLVNIIILTFTIVDTELVELVIQFRPTATYLGISDERRGWLCW